MEINTMNLYDMLLAETKLMSAEQANKLSDLYKCDDKEYADKDFMRFIKAFGQDMEEAIRCGHKSVYLNKRCGLTDKEEQYLKSLGYTVEKYAECSFLLKRVVDDFPNKEVYCWVIRWGEDFENHIGYGYATEEDYKEMRYKGVNE